MIDRSIAQKILTIGCDYNPPKGGIAMVEEVYFNHILCHSYFIANSCEGTKLRKIKKAFFSYIKTFFFLLTHNSISIVHIHSSAYNSFRRSSYFLKLAKLFKKKTILHIHSGNFDIYCQHNKEYVLRNMKYVDILVALSPRWKIYFERKKIHQNVVIIPNVVAPISDEATKKENNVVHGLFMGDLTQRKGIYDLLQAIKEDADFLKNKFILHIAGKGEEESLINYIKSMHLEEIVRYEGWICGDKKTKMLQNAHCFILPSYAEGLPISILEAEINKNAIIATYVGGVPDIVSEDNGYLFSPGDIGKLKSILRKILSDKMHLALMGEKSYIKAQEHLPINVEKELLNIYLSLLNNV